MVGIVTGCSYDHVYTRAQAGAHRSVPPLGSHDFVLFLPVPFFSITSNTLNLLVFVENTLTDITFILVPVLSIILNKPSCKRCSTTTTSSS